MNIEERYGEKIKCNQCGREILLDEFSTERIGVNTVVVYCENGCESLLDEKF
ncbi:hypothetical protein [Clostridium botulinum]|uniref:hypothetical protein n=1 Tax=Clostridium botulinum TaxID=1491 RepID=UPI000AFAD0A7|nr:hypothetical protein [Clostridium botulinum]